MKNAKDVFSGTNYSQAVVDQAASALKTVTLTLVKIGDKTALKAAIDTAKTYTKDKYGADAMKWGVFEKALTKAETVYADPNVDQLQIDDAKSGLESAQSKLVAATPDSGESNEGEAGDKVENTETDATEEVTEEATEAVDESTGEGEKKKKCGSSVAISALAIVGVLGSALVIKKRD